MRPVGAKEHPIGRHVSEELRDLVLPEGSDPDLRGEHLEGILREVTGVPVGGVPQAVPELGHPRGTVLYAGEPQGREALEEQLADGGSVEVHDGSTLGDDAAKGGAED